MLRKPSDRTDNGQLLKFDAAIVLRGDFPLVLWLAII
jgi:hypothetical protein